MTSVLRPMMIYRVNSSVHMKDKELRILEVNAVMSKIESKVQSYPPKREEFYRAS